MKKLIVSISAFVFLVSISSLWQGCAKAGSAPVIDDVAETSGGTTVVSSSPFTLKYIGTYSYTDFTDDGMGAYLTATYSKEAGVVVSGLHIKINTSSNIELTYKVQSQTETDQMSSPLLYADVTTLANQAKSPYGNNHSGTMGGVHSVSTTDAETYDIKISGVMGQTMTQGNFDLYVIEETIPDYPTQ